MEITSLSFLGFVAGVVIAFHLHPAPIYRLSIITVANLVFIGTYATQLLEVIPLLFFLMLGYVAVTLAGTRRSASVTGIGIGFVLITYLFLKKFSFIDSTYLLSFPYIVVGLSYILFRIIHLIIDASSGDLPGRISPVSFFNYTCNFLSFVSGPIQLYQDFVGSESGSNEKISATGVFHAVNRIISGYAKVIIVSGFANYGFAAASARILAPDLAMQEPRLMAAYGFCAITYTIYLYYNFSGYMDIVIGIANLLGRDLPENFNKPFLARNFLEFWSRWHMTLSLWFKTYLFNPLVKLLIDQLPQQAMVPFLGVIAFFVTFFVMGVWHGTTPVFAIYGLLMGAGASINKLWQLFAADRLGRRGYRALSGRRLYIYACRGLTSAFFIIGVSCLWLNLDQLLRLWGALGAVGLSTTLLLTAAACGIAMFISDLVVGRSRVWFDWAKALSRPGILGNFCAAAQILMILMVSTFFHKAPEFVYRAF